MLLVGEDCWCGLFPGIPGIPPGCGIPGIPPGCDIPGIPPGCDIPGIGCITRNEILIFEDSCLKVHLLTRACQVFCSAI